MADETSDSSAVASLHGELGRLCHDTQDYACLVAAWDALSALGTSSRANNQKLSLARLLVETASEAFKSGNSELAVMAMTRVETYHDGKGYGTLSLDPEWLPQLYLETGDPGRAQRIHRVRLARAIEEGEPLAIADRLRGYADYLDHVRRYADASRARAEADRIETERKHEVESLKSWPRD